MTRFITTTLTLVLTAGLSSSDVSAQDALGISMVNTAESGLMIDPEGLYQTNELELAPSLGLDGLIAIIALAATETGIIDPDDCPQVVDACLDRLRYPLDRTPSVIDPADCPRIVDPNDCPEIMDLWFELVDAGYTEDEAFDLVEMVMGEDMRYESAQSSNDPVFFSHHAHIDYIW